MLKEPSDFVYVKRRHKVNLFQNQSDGTNNNRCKVNVLEEPPEGPRRDEKTIIWVNDYLLEEPPEGPRRDERKHLLGHMFTSSKSPRRAPGGMKKTIICVNAYLREEPPEG